MAPSESIKNTLPFLLLRYQNRVGKSLRCKTVMINILKGLLILILSTKLHLMHVNEYIIISMTKQHLLKIKCYLKKIVLLISEKRERQMDITIFKTRFLNSINHTFFKLFYSVLVLYMASTLCRLLLFRLQKTDYPKIEKLFIFYVQNNK